MIEQLTLKAGRSPESPAEPITLTPITVFVGPNNSGKSKILEEIQLYCSTGELKNIYVLLSGLKLSTYSQDKCREIIESYRPNAALYRKTLEVGKVYIARNNDGQSVSEETLCRCMQEPNEDPYRKILCASYINYQIIRLDGKNRISLIDQQNAGDLQVAPTNTFQTLFANDQKRFEVRRILFDAFGSYFILDLTNLGYIRARLSSIAPVSPSLERGIDAVALDFQRQAQLISEASDGVKAFTGIITEVIAGEPKILLIDEPEAFLHPALAFKLGKEISRASSDLDKRLFVSTHSPQFVMGCINSGAPVNIVRLTYRNGIATSRVLSHEMIVELMRNPLLRSTNVLNALFYECVIVTESDADRAFYQEINDRLVEFKSKWGIPNCLFINAQNKQTVRKLLKPLRALGIPTVGIVDIDVLKDGGKDWSELMDSMNVPEMLHNLWSQHRSAIKSKFEGAGLNMKRDGGIKALHDSEREAANQLFNQLADYGLFVVRGGELESWLKELNAPGHGPNWLIDIFEKMGEDPNATNYLKPSEGDVWAFLGTIKQWMVNPTRKGIPN